MLLPAILAGYAVAKHHENIAAGNASATSAVSAVSTVSAVPGSSGAAVQTTVSATAKQPVFQHKKQEPEIGTAQSITDYQKNYAFGIQYPVTGNAVIDTQIKAAAERFAADFTKQAGGYKAGSAAGKAVMAVDYKAYIETDKPAPAKGAAGSKSGTYSYLSLVFDVTVDIPGGNIHSRKIKTCFFDQITGKMLGPGDVFTGNYLSLISKNIIACCKNDKIYRAHTKDALFLKNTAAKADNFSSFAVAKGYAFFYFDRQRILPEKFGCISIPVPVAELYRVLKVKMTGLEVLQPVQPGDKLLALTFDDGPRPSVTNRILDALGKAGGRATFFTLGLMIDGKASNNAILRAYRMGCEIGNHSYSHKKFTTRLSAKDLRYQIDQPNRMIKRITGESPKLFRIPYGYVNAKVIKNVHMPLINWNVDTKDWAYKDIDGKPRSKTQRNKDLQKVVNSILNSAEDGDIVIMHDIYTFSADVCEKVIPELVKRGFKLVTVSEMFEARGKTLKDGVVYTNANK